jgi:hypothetical protein
MCVVAALGLAIAAPSLQPHLVQAAGLEDSAGAGLRESLESATERSFTSVGRLSADVLRLALGAAQCALTSQAVSSPATLTIIDYSRPSTEPRLWVLDLVTRTLLYEELVAHGNGTGENLAVRFSNALNSHQSSLGLFVTGDTYVGSNGYSLRLDGLDPGFNDRARERAIVMHGAPYVSEAFSRKFGRLGRSWGCPALNEGIARQVIDRIKGGHLLFAYYPDPAWLARSPFLGNCSTRTTN